MQASYCYFTPRPHPSPYFWSLTAPLVQIYFSPQPSAAIKIKNGGHNIRYEITEHSLAKITSALQAKNAFYFLSPSLGNSYPSQDVVG